VSATCYYCVTKLACFFRNMPAFGRIGVIRAERATVRGASCLSRGRPISNVRPLSPLILPMRQSVRSAARKVASAANTAYALDDRTPSWDVSHAKCASAGGDDSSRFQVAMTTIICLLSLIFSLSFGLAGRCGGESRSISSAG
jgi:hypothetical protein